MNRIHLSNLTPTLTPRGPPVSSGHCVGFRIDVISDGLRGIVARKPGPELLPRLSTLNKPIGARARGWRPPTPVGGIASPWLGVELGVRPAR